MELEQRIKTLEYEMKILKNEVQRTLLDIQEQVLVHYYPTLRTEESKPSEGMIKALDELRARQASQSAAPVIKKVSLEEVRGAQRELAAESPQANRSALKLAEGAKQADPGAEGNENGHGQGNGNGSGNGNGNGDSNIAAPTSAERANRKLREWLMNSAAKVGNDHDGKQVKEVLDQLTELNSLVGRTGSMEEALRLIQEAKLG